MKRTVKSEELSLAKKIVFSLIPLLVLILIMEISLTAHNSITGQVVYLEGDNFFGELREEYPLKANYSFIFTGNRVRLPPSNITTNSHGLRDYEFDFTKPDSAYRIISLGDSLTFGQGVNLNETFSKILEKKLNIDSEKINYEVLNFGIPGDNTLDELRLLEELGLRFNPDLVILTVVNNDHEIREDIIKENSYLDALRQKFLSNSYLQINKWLEAKVLLYEYYHYNKQIDEDQKKQNIMVPFQLMVNLTREKNIKLIVVGYRGSFIRYPYLKEFIKDRGIGYIDLGRELHNYSFKEIYLVASDERVFDGHLSLKGNVLTADLIFNYLKEHGYIK